MCNPQPYQWTWNVLMWKPSDLFYALRGYRTFQSFFVRHCHLEKIDSLRGVCLPVAVTQYWKFTHFLISTAVSSEKSLSTGNCRSHGGWLKFPKILVFSWIVFRCSQCIQHCQLELIELLHSCSRNGSDSPILNDHKNKKQGRLRNFNLLAS